MRGIRTSKNKGMKGDPPGELNPRDPDGSQIDVYGSVLRKKVIKFGPDDKIKVIQGNPFLMESGSRWPNRVCP